MQTTQKKVTESLLWIKTDNFLLWDYNTNNQGIVLLAKQNIH